MDRPGTHVNNDEMVPPSGTPADGRHEKESFPRLKRFFEELPVVPLVALLVTGLIAITMFRNSIDSQINYLEQQISFRLNRVEERLSNDIQDLRIEFKQLNTTLMNNLLQLNRDVGELKGSVRQERQDPPLPSSATRTPPPGTSQTP